MNKRRKAKAVQQAKPAPSHIPTIQEDIVLRQQNALRENASVSRLSSIDKFRGDFRVASKQWQESYLVELRDLEAQRNSCTCQDFQMSRLGTCKHIERALMWSMRGKKRLFKQVAKDASPCYEIYFDPRGEHPIIRLLRPANLHSSIESKLSGLFDADGVAMGPLPEAWSAIERAVQSLSAHNQQGVRLTRHSEIWLPRARFIAGQKELRRKFEQDVANGKRSDNPVLVPLYPYQKQGMKHLAFAGRALLADEMGLGKTIQAIAAAELLRQLGKIKRVLIVCPASLKSEWEDQIKQFTGIQPTLVFGSRPARLSLYAEPHAYYVTNYEQVRSEVDDINRILLPDLVILDEAQRIKNWPTRTAKTIKRLHSPYAFILTGTPLENRVEELYSLIEFIDPRLLGSVTAFYRAFMRVTEDKQLVPNNMDALHRVVTSVMLRRRKIDVETSLPARSDKTYLVTMTPEQRRRYGEYEGEVAKLIAIMKRRPLTKKEQEYLQLLLACMRMVCDTPYILDEKCRDCPKLEELEVVLEEALADPSTKIIIFSEWVRMLDLVKELLEARHIGFAEHSGRIAQQHRRAHIQRFKTDPGCRVFLTSDAGSTGLNLQVANVVVNMDLPWNPARLEQRIARAWRKHQQRSVRVINLVTERSIEQAMIGKLAVKRALADAILDGAEFRVESGGESGRKTFAARLGALLGQETGEPPPEQQSRSPTAPRKRPLKEELVARYRDALLGIETLPDNRGALVVVRHGAPMEAIKAHAAETGSHPVEVITPDIKDLLLRLQSAGLITLTGKLQNEYAAEGYEPVAAPPPSRPILHKDAARKHWRQTANDRKAFDALADLGLAEQSLHHARHILKVAHESVILLHAGQLDTDPIIPPDSPGAMLIASIKAAPATPDTLAQMNLIFQQVDELLVA